MAEKRHQVVLQFCRRSRTTTKSQITIVRWGKHRKLGTSRMNWNPWEWIGVCTPLMTEVICPRSQSFVTDSRVTEIGRESLELKLGTWLLPHTYKMSWQKRRQRAWCATMPCTGPPGVKVHDCLHLSDLRQNTSVAHTIPEIFREGSENLLPA